MVSLTVLVAADQLQPAVRDTGRRAVVSRQTALGLVSSQLILVVYGAPARGRRGERGELGSLRGAPEADVAVRSSTQDKRGALRGWSLLFLVVVVVAAAAAVVSWTCCCWCCYYMYVLVVVEEPGRRMG